MSSKTGKSKQAAYWRAIVRVCKCVEQFRSALSSRPYCTMSMSMPIFRRRIRRLFKFSSMDFDLAIWEMTSLLTSPKAVFKGFYYHKQTKNTYHRPDPSFTYLLVSLLFITSLAWGFAYLPSVSFTSLLKLSLSFVFIQFLGVALLISTTMYFLARKVFCMGGFLSRWRGAERIVKRFGLGLIGGRRRGLFVDTTATSNEVEFGYCFDVCSPKSPEYMKNFAIDPLLMVRAPLLLLFSSFAMISRFPIVLFSPSSCSCTSCNSSCYPCSRISQPSSPCCSQTPFILSHFHTTSTSLSSATNCSPACTTPKLCSSPSPFLQLCG